jgi:BirA family biotin operon repressor/biotin-[acetyl-CoA-carboxylase] ligase
MTAAADVILAGLYDAGGDFADPSAIPGAPTGGTALAAALDELRARGHTIEPGPAGRVRLARPVRPDAFLLERDLPVRRVGCCAICFDEVDSTSDVAAASLRQGGCDGLAVTAEFQRAGRGRLGRRWLSPPGANLLMSVVLDARAAPLPPHDALTLAAGLSVAEGVDDAADVGCSLKWPNDVELDGAKLAGVLVELHNPPPGAIVGIGVNVRAAPPGGEVDRPAASLASAVGHDVDRIALARAILARLDAWLASITDDGRKQLHDAWLARSDMVNQRVTIASQGREYTGRVLDVQPSDGLAVRCDDGVTVHLPASGASVLPGT